jgi:hypothetical protein
LVSIVKTGWYFYACAYCSVLKEKMIAITNIVELEDKHEASDYAGNRIPVEIRQQILRAIASIEYGSVEVILHDGKVMQIESREKIRVNHNEPAARK